MTDADRAYHFIKQIPKGKVTTYGQIAKLAGGLNPRYIGYLLHHNPDPETIPCHRVVNSHGMLASGFAFGGAIVQKKLLEKEAIVVRDDFSVDLTVYQWGN